MTHLSVPTQLSLWGYLKQTWLNNPKFIENIFKADALKEFERQVEVYVAFAADFRNQIFVILTERLPWTKRNKIPLGQQLEHAIEMCKVRINDVQIRVIYVTGIVRNQITLTQYEYWKGKTDFSDLLWYSSFSQYTVQVTYVNEDCKE